MASISPSRSLGAESKDHETWPNLHDLIIFQRDPRDTTSIDRLLPQAGDHWEKVACSVLQRKICPCQSWVVHQLAKSLIRSFSRKEATALAASEVQRTSQPSQGRARARDLLHAFCLCSVRGLFPLELGQWPSSSSTGPVQLAMLEACSSAGGQQGEPPACVCVFSPLLPQ